MLNIYAERMLHKLWENSSTEGVKLSLIEVILTNKITISKKIKSQIFKFLKKHREKEEDSSSVARAFPGGRLAHPESQNEEENEQNLRKYNKN